MIITGNKCPQLFILLFISFFLSACGGSGTHFDGSNVSTEERQNIAKIAVDSTNLYDLMSLIVTTADSVRSVPSGSVALTCQRGSGVISVINTAPVESFDSGDLILINARNCVGTDGSIQNGEFSVSGDGNRLIGDFRNYGAGRNTELSGKITVIPTSNYNPRTGTGALRVTIDALTGIENEKTTLLSDGQYLFSLSGNSYTYSLDHKISSSQFAGVARIRSTNTGLTGTTNLINNELRISNPLSGELIIAFPDESTGEVFVNNADPSSYDIRINGETVTTAW